MRAKSALSLQTLAQYIVTRIDRKANVDHQEHFNFYLSKYQKMWEEDFKKSKTMSRCVLVTNYIQHIVDKNAKVFLGQNIKRTGYFSMT